VKAKKGSSEAGEDRSDGKGTVRRTEEADSKNSAGPVKRLAVE
jgi:hypothetical protein